MMTESINQVFAAAMALDADSRRDLAERLWDTVQTKEDTVFSESTWEEIGLRVAASDAGHAEHIPGHAALEQIRAEFGLPKAG
ncbi:hypothetical protein EI77_03417 [Prosthecobacter fusiformis]|uniref:Addiction module component n=1 Tax=Prosthecobacter fusiformis TaxID=48464 RepID=A0A4R7RR00_9BACT|nr:hypothetical protein [Prosthecobacter fusiformis]TDU67215.1 hypothetical protein EI77_03417 [Prosthecobacter fusiformis]